MDTGFHKIDNNYWIMDLLSCKKKQLLCFLYFANPIFLHKQKKYQKAVFGTLTEFICISSINCE